MMEKTAFYTDAGTGPFRTKLQCANVERLEKVTELLERNGVQHDCSGPEPAKDIAELLIDNWSEIQEIARKYDEVI